MLEALQFVNYRRSGSEGPWRAGLLRADGVTDLGPSGRPADEAGDAGEPAVRAAGVWAASGAADADAVVTGPLEFGTPVLKPSKIVAAAANYSDHAGEMPGSRGTIERQGFFLKAPSSLLAPGGTVRLPFPGRRTDYEGELAVIIGKRAWRLSEDDALDAVLGYTCLLDVSLRGEEDRGFRKSFDTFTPLGKGLAPRDTIADLSSCELTTTVNGEVRQQATLGQMIYGVPRLLAWISSVMTLLPGDVIATGTPRGVGPLHAGDDVSVRITGVSALSVKVTEQ